MTTLATTAPNTGTYVSQFASGKYGGSFARSLKSELIKLRIPSTIITSIAAIVIYTGLSSLLASSTNGAQIDLAWATGGWSLVPMFMVVLGTLAVTNEYSTNTMRTTTLAQPRRTRGLAAKALAVTLLAAIVSVVTLMLSVAAMYLLAPQVVFETEDLWKLAMFPVVMIAMALTAMGLGYVLRSTAGTITLMFALIYLTDLLSLINLDFFRDTLPKFYISQVSAAIIENPEPGTWGLPILEGRPVALIVLFAYVVIALVAGALAYKRRDV